MNEAVQREEPFLEEAAKESLNVDYLSIAEIALQADHPPNFNDQCSAFISSDIKNALHEGLSKENIIAGLAYSICLNYTNRVKGIVMLEKKFLCKEESVTTKQFRSRWRHLPGKKLLFHPSRD